MIHRLWFVLIWNFYFWKLAIDNFQSQKQLKKPLRIIIGHHAICHHTYWPTMWDCSSQQGPFFVTLPPPAQDLFESEHFCTFSVNLTCNFHRKILASSSNCLTGGRFRLVIVSSLLEVNQVLIAWSHRPKIGPMAKDWRCWCSLWQKLRFSVRYSVSQSVSNQYIKSSMKVIHESHPWKSSMKVIFDSQW